MKRISACLLFFTFFASIVSAQSIQELTPEQYFDFWVGDWNLTYLQSDGTTATAENYIMHILGGTVIQENFSVLTGNNSGYAGKSWSVFNPNTKHWQQTWVDNQGAYLTFDGAVDGEKRIFSRSFANPDGDTVLQRMVFYDIQKESFSWDWESSQDNGTNWQLLWRIQYERKQEKDKK